MNNTKEYMDNKFPGLDRAIKVFNLTASSSRMAVFLRGDKREKGSFEQKLSAQDSGVITNADSVLIFSFPTGTKSIQLSLQVLPYGINTLHQTLSTGQTYAWVKKFQNLMANQEYSDYGEVDYDAEVTFLLKQEL